MEDMSYEAINISFSMVVSFCRSSEFEKRQTVRNAHKPRASNRGAFAARLNHQQNVIRQAAYSSAATRGIH